MKINKQPLNLFSNLFHKLIRPQYLTILIISLFLLSNIQIPSNSQIKAQKLTQLEKQNTHQIQCKVINIYTSDVDNSENIIIFKSDNNNFYPYRQNKSDIKININDRAVITIHDNFTPDNTGDDDILSYKLINN